MGETGRRFKRAFRSTPTQAQVMLEDPFGHTDAPERTVWYQSKFLRANLHFRGTEFYLRDLHVYDDRFPQPYLTEPVRQHGIEQRLLAVLDGYHWSDDKVRAGNGRRAMGRFVLIGPDGQETPLAMDGLPTVSEKGASCGRRCLWRAGETSWSSFTSARYEFSVVGGPPQSRLGLKLEWVAGPQRTQKGVCRPAQLPLPRLRLFHRLLRTGRPQRQPRESVSRPAVGCATPAHGAK